MLQEIEGLDDMFELVRMTNDDYLEIQEKKEKLKHRIKKTAENSRSFTVRPLDCNLQVCSITSISTSVSVRSQIEYYHKMQKYLMDDLGARSSWRESGMKAPYMARISYLPGESLKVDAVFRSLHFERVALQGGFDGTPTEAFMRLDR